MTAQTETRTELFIDGEERAPSGSDYYQLHNPARPDEVVGEAHRDAENQQDTADEQTAFGHHGRHSRADFQIAINHGLDEKRV